MDSVFLGDAEATISLKFTVNGDSGDFYTFNVFEAGSDDEGPNKAKYLLLNGGFQYSAVRRRFAER